MITLIRFIATLTIPRKNLYLQPSFSIKFDENNFIYVTKIPHNNELHNPDLEKYLDVDINTEKMYTDSFSEGITTSEAL